MKATSTKAWTSGATGRRADGGGDGRTRLGCDGGHPGPERKDPGRQRHAKQERPAPRCMSQLHAHAAGKKTGQQDNAVGQDENDKRGKQHAQKTADRDESAIQPTLPPLRIARHVIAAERHFAAGRETLQDFQRDQKPAGPIAGHGVGGQKSDQRSRYRHAYHAQLERGRSAIAIAHEAETCAADRACQIAAGEYREAQHQRCLVGRRGKEQATDLQGHKSRQRKLIPLEYIGGEGDLQHRIQRSTHGAPRLIRAKTRRRSPSRTLLRNASRWHSTVRGDIPSRRAISLLA